MADKTGLWLIGARGAVATTVAVGWSGLRRRGVEKLGLVTELPGFRSLKLPAWDQLVVGGHDLRGGDLPADATRFFAENRLPANQVAAAEGDLTAIEANLRTGESFRDGVTPDGTQPSPTRSATDSPRAAIERIKADLVEFRERHNLGQVVVVLLTSTEPETPLDALPSRWRDLRMTLETNAACSLRSSSLYAIATLELGMPFVNFTPSLGSDCPAIRELATEAGAAHAGRDGKTGETLLKSVLAPMFSARHLNVMSWVGHNLLGNDDGRSLAEPEMKATKVNSKNAALAAMLGYEPQMLTSIEPIASLGDWKTAWDHVHFQGFLGVPMTLQFTWQGSDSALAAPLVLDLARLATHAASRGETGVLDYLASFFKSPIGPSAEQTCPAPFFEQFAMLAEYAKRVSDDAPRANS